MNKITMLFFGILVFLKAEAQTQLHAGFNSTIARRNISVGISKTKNTKHEFGAALRINLNKLEHNDDQDKIYYKRLYVSEFAHNFGIQGFYHRHVLQKLEHVKPFFFYDIQATHSTAMNRLSYDDVRFKRGDLYVFGPFTWVEQNIGDGFRADLFGNWFLQQKLGIGTTLIFGADMGTRYNITQEFGGLFNLGLGYKIQRGEMKNP